MKRLLFILLPLVIFSCSTGDDTPVDHLQILPIENAILPNVFELDSTYNIQLTYLKPTNCHAFNDIYYGVEANERTVAIITTVFGDITNCQEIATEQNASFNFRATELGSYVFKFWQGTNAADEDEYMVIEVPVTE